MRSYSVSAQSVPPRAKSRIGTNADRFQIISNLSHELRSPLHVINGYLDVLAEDWAARLGGEPEHILGRLRLSVAELKQTVENLLEYAAAMTATQAAVMEPVDVTELVTELDQTFASAARRKKIFLLWQVEPHLTLVYSDRRRLVSIIANLVSNAIMFTARGVVTVRLGQARGRHHDEIELEVADTGIGMEQGRVEDAFAPFVQLSSSNARAHRGLGLGLALVRRNVLSLGASLDVRSKPSAGTSFKVRFAENPRADVASIAGCACGSSYVTAATVRTSLQSHRRNPRHGGPARQPRDRSRRAVEVCA